MFVDANASFAINHHHDDDVTTSHKKRLDLREKENCHVRESVIRQSTSQTVKVWSNIQSLSKSSKIKRTKMQILISLNFFANLDYMIIMVELGN